MLAVHLAAQTGVKLRVQVVPLFEASTLKLEQDYPLPGNNKISFETLRFYFSGLAFYRDGIQVFSEENSYHLMDLSDENSMHAGIQLPEGLIYNSIGFNIGVDSIMNTSGAQSGDLDPVHGMYWAWQSGYINFKLEGTSNLCTTRKNRFQFHLGGYLPPNNAMQRVQLPVKQDADIIIEMPVDRFLSQLDLSKQNTIMIPCAEAVTLSRNLAGLFEIRHQ